MGCACPRPTACPGLKESQNQPLRCSWVPSKWEHSMIPRCCPINNNTCHLKLQPTASQTSPYPPKSRAALWSRGHNHFITAPITEFPAEQSSSKRALGGPQ